jgi:hypothetical protein
VVIADLNGDSKNDILVGYVPYANVLLNSGNAQFLGSVQVPNSGMGLAVADFNGDGSPDFATYGVDPMNTTNGSDVFVWLNNGHGTFGSPSSTRFETTEVGMIPHGVKAADIDGDGKQDLVVDDSLQSDSKAYVLLGKGDGTFKTPAAYTLPKDARALALADLNGDGKADIAAQTYESGVDLLMNNGDGTFATAAVTAAHMDGSYGWDIAAANLNGTMGLVAQEDWLSGPPGYPIFVITGNCE